MAKIEMFYKKPWWDKPECVYRDLTLSDSDAEHKFYEFRGKDTWCNPFNERKATDYYFLCVVTYGKKRDHERIDFGGYFDSVGYEAVHEMYKTFGKMFNTPKGRALYRTHKIKWFFKEWSLRLAFLVCAFLVAYVVADFKNVAHKINVRLGIEKEVVYKPVETGYETRYDKPDSTWCGELNGDYVTCRKHFGEMMEKWYGENTYSLKNTSHVKYEIKGNSLYLYSYSFSDGIKRRMFLYEKYPYIVDCDFDVVYCSVFEGKDASFSIMYERGDVRPDMSTDQIGMEGYPVSEADSATLWNTFKRIAYPPYGIEQDSLDRKHNKAVAEWCKKKYAERDAYKAQYRKDFIAHKDSLYKKHNIKY